VVEEQEPDVELLEESRHALVGFGRERRGTLVGYQYGDVVGISCWYLV